MLRSPWVTGEAYMIADPDLFTIARGMDIDRVDPHAFPGVLDQPDRMADGQARARKRGPA